MRLLTLTMEAFIHLCNLLRTAEGRGICALYTQVPKSFTGEILGQEMFQWLLSTGNCLNALI